MTACHKEPRISKREAPRSSMKTDVLTHADPISAHLIHGGVLKRRDRSLMGGLGGSVGRAGSSVGHLQAAFRVWGELCGARGSFPGVGVCFRRRLLARHGAMV